MDYEIRVGDKIEVMEDNAHSTNEPAGAILTVTHIRDGHFVTDSSSTYTWLWVYSCFDRGEIRLLKYSDDYSPDLWKEGI